MSEGRRVSIGDEFPGVSEASCLIAGMGELDCSAFADATEEWGSVGGDKGLLCTPVDPLPGSCFDTAAYAREGAGFESPDVGRYEGGSYALS